MRTQQTKLCGRSKTHDANNNEMNVPVEEDSRLQPLNAGSRGMARDPAVIYELAEKRSCVGCSHEYRIAFGNQHTTYCGLGIKRHPKRCGKYEESER